MSDRTDENRPSDGAGGWFVPKNALTEQEIAASQQPSAPASDAPLPGTLPEQPGAWYVPPDAVPRATEVAASASTPAPSIPLPQGAALSSDADYSNYVPGVGFVSSAQASNSTPDTT